MTTRVALLLAAILLEKGTVPCSAQQPTPSFKSRIDLVQVDVVIVDGPFSSRTVSRQTGFIVR